MELIRTIHPVGHGGFCTETLKEGNKEINIVYDCGGKSEAFMKTYLNDCFKQSEIEIVFISHFHNDHINGLETLLKKTKVKYIVLPQLTNDLMLEALIYNSEKESDINEFLLKIYNKNNIDDTKIIKVKQHKHDEDFRLKIPSVDETFSLSAVSNNGNIIDMQNENMIDSGTSFVVSKWLYSPYNPYVKEGFYDFFKQEMCNGVDFDIFEIKDFIKDRVVKKKGKKDEKTCFDVYMNFYGEKNQNEYSMSVYSGPIRPRRIGDMVKKDMISHPLKLREIIKDKNNRYSNSFYKYNFNPAFLYTGDFKANKRNVKEMKSFYCGLWDNLESLQVPHHGSEYDNNIDLYCGIKKVYISAGKNDKKHPSKKTIAKIESQKCMSNIVTEDFDTIQQTWFNIK